MEHKMCQERQSSSQVQLHVRVLREVDQKLQRLGADDYLTLKDLCRVSLSVECHLVIHGLYIGTDLQVGEYLDKLTEIFHDQTGHSFVS